MKKSTYKVLYSNIQNKDFGFTLFDRCKQQFFWAVKWNVLESLLYHVVFITHQGFLYKIFGQEIYGKIGSLTGFLFLLVTLFLGALDTTLIGYIQFFTQSKKHFKILVKEYIIRHSVFIVIAPFTLCLLKYCNKIPFIQDLSWQTSFLIGILVILETIRKLLRHTLQLMFFNKQTTSLEIIGIILYVLVFWTSYWNEIEMNPNVILIPFLIPSLFSVIYSSFLFFKKLNTLEDFTNEPIHIIGFRKAQFYNFINQIVRSLFSSNFLIPLFAFSSGYMEAGIASLANYITYTFAFFIHKICTPAAAALFSHTNTLTQEEQQQAFGLTIKLFSLLAALGLSILIFYGWITFSSLSFKAISYAAFFFLVHIIEHLYTLYEKFFASQNKLKLLTLLNIITCFVSGYSFWIMHTSFFIESIIISLSLRIGLLIMLSCIIFRVKNAPILSFFYKKQLETSI